LYLSANTVAEPCVVRDQPSGTFTVYPPPDGDHGTYTCVSGMSPGGFVSFGTADDDEADEADEEDADEVDVEDDEQAAAPAPAPATRTSPAAAEASARRIGRHLPRRGRCGHRRCLRR
jgi:hypothetical protein